MRALFFVLALSCFGCAQMGPAHEWSADASSGTVADDNWSFNQDKISSVGVTASIAAAAKVVAPTYELGVEGNALHTEFASNQLPPAQEYGVSLHAATEYNLGSSRATIGFRLSDTLLGGQDRVAAATVNETERTTWMAASSTRELGPRTAASFEVSGSRVQYSSPVPNRADYDFASIGLGIQHEITATLAGSLRLSADSNQTAATPITVAGLRLGSEQQKGVSIGPVVGLVWEAAERYQWTVDLSPRRRVNTSDVTLALPGLPAEHSSTQTADLEYDGNVGVARVFDRGVVRMGIHRNLVPGTYGQLRTRDSADLSASRELSADSSLSIAASVAVEQEETVAVSSRKFGLTNTRWVNGEVTYARRFGANLAVTASYHYRTEKTDSVDAIASNALSLTLTYHMGNTA